MRRTSLLLVALLAVAATLMPAPGDDSGTCGKPYDRADVCLFYLRGTPIHIEGEANRESGPTRVRVWVTIAAGAEETTLVACDGTGGKRASCTARFDPFDRMLDSTKHVALITCHVESNGSGTYLCRSALGF